VIDQMEESRYSRGINCCIQQ